MYTVLIVEDNLTDQMILRKVFEQKGYQVLVSSEAHNALEIANNYNIDLILLDWHLPHYSGLDILKTLRKIKKYVTTPIVIVSGRNEMKDVQKALQNGASDYIIKPLDLLIIISKAERLLSKTSNWNSVSISETEYGDAVLLQQLKIDKISEIGIEIETSTGLSIGSTHKVSGKLSESLGMEFLLVRVFENIQNTENAFKYKCILLGLKEAELQKLRLILRECHQAELKVAS